MKTKAAVLVASDSRSSGARKDETGSTAANILEEAGFYVVSVVVKPDDREIIAGQLASWCDESV